MRDSSGFSPSPLPPALQKIEQGEQEDEKLYTNLLFPSYKSAASISDQKQPHVVPSTGREFKNHKMTKLLDGHVLA